MSMEKVLFAVDELTGLIGAAALMRPSKSVEDLEVKSVKKKFKDKKFAAGCSRDVIRVILVDSSLYRCFKVCVVCHIYSSSFVFGISIVIVSPIAKDWLNALLKLGNCWS